MQGRPFCSSPVGTALHVAQPADPVNVFVTTVGAADGFTDPSKDNRDTAEDLRNSIEIARGWQSPSAADRNGHIENVG
jgi:hypothetical protein